MATRKRSQEPLNIDDAVESIAGRVRMSGACPLGKLGVPKANRPEVLARLHNQGFEITRSNVRQPLGVQLRAVLAAGAFLTLKTLKAHLVAATAAEAKAAALELVRAGDAHLVLRAGTPTLVPANVEVVGERDLARLASGLDAALKQVRKVARAEAKLLREDLTTLLAPWVRSRAVEREEASSSLVERARSAVGAATDPRLGLAFVPAVVRSLSEGANVADALEALREAAQRGLIELRPESGLGRLSSEEQRLCVPGPEGSWLSWARLGRETDR